MSRVSRPSILAASLCLLLGAVPGLAGPPNNDVSDSQDNTAGGTNALVSNSGGLQNTAFGFGALATNATGSQNTAFGTGALQLGTSGSNNTAVGNFALNGPFPPQPVGNNNTAIGAFALQLNTTGEANTAVGSKAIGGCSDACNINTGSQNTAIGSLALLLNTTGNANTAVGQGALEGNESGSNNIALGFLAGDRLLSGSNDIYLGNRGGGFTESNTIRLGQVQTRTFIAGIAGSHVSGSQVVVNSSGQLGILASSARYKRDIRDMGARSRGLVGLRPVTFRYKQDPKGERQYGLIAEEVAKVYPELVTRRSDGTVESVQYQELIPMLLNELQRQQRELGELKVQNGALQGTLVEQTAALKARLVRLEAANHTAALANR